MVWECAARYRRGGGWIAVDRVDPSRVHDDVKRETSCENQSGGPCRHTVQSSSGRLHERREVLFVVRLAGIYPRSRELEGRRKTRVNREKEMSTAGQERKM